MSRSGSARLLCLLVPAITVGCANPGPPRAPSLNLPELAKGLQAQRLGDQVILSWTTSATSTDGTEIKGQITAAVCLDSGPPPAAHPACPTVMLVRVSPGPSTAAMTLTPAQLKPPAALLAYRVELQNQAGRSAGRSDAALAASGPAPPPVGTLAIEATPEGALLTWQRSNSPAVIELHRVRDTGPMRAQTPGKRSAGFDKPTAEVILRSSEAADAGGVVDRALLDPKLDGVRFVYVAQRMESTTLAGHTLLLHGLPSPPAPFTFHDVFPPAQPTGLLAVASRNPPTIDLSWEASDDANLAGYNLYRAKAGGGFERGSFERMNSDLLPAPAFHDLQAKPGQRYRYHVTAVDRRGNESSASGDVSEQIPQP